jgi:putative tricarboxylic transport membrane protein
MSAKQIVLRTVGIGGTAALVAFAAINASGSSGEATPTSQLMVTVPAAPGGGWDLVGREIQQAMRGEGLSNNVQVVNVPGAGGTIGLAQFASFPGDPTALMITGTVMAGAIITNGSSATLDDTTPIARLANDYEAVMVPAESPFQTLDDFLEAWRANPHSVAVGGGSIGGTDQLLAGLVMQAAGIDPGQLNYIAYSGGGEVLTSLLSNTVDVAISGYNEFGDQIEAGNLRALAISSEKPVDGIDVPTFIDQGIDVALPNWRGVVARGGISDQERQALIDVLTDMRATPSWRDTLERNQWTDSFLAGDEFTRFIAEDQTRIAGIIEELGL